MHIKHDNYLDYSLHKDTFYTEINISFTKEK